MRPLLLHTHLLQVLVEAGLVTVASVRLESLGVLVEKSQECLCPSPCEINPGHFQDVSVVRTCRVYRELSAFLFPLCSCRMDFVLDVGTCAQPLRRWLPCLGATSAAVDSSTSARLEAMSSTLALWGRGWSLEIAALVVSQRSPRLSTSFRISTGLCFGGSLFRRLGANRPLRRTAAKTRSSPEAS